MKLLREKKNKSVVARFLAAMCSLLDSSSIVSIDEVSYKSALDGMRCVSGINLSFKLHDANEVMLLMNAISCMISGSSKKDIALTSEYFSKRHAMFLKETATDEDTGKTIAYFCSPDGKLTNATAKSSLSKFIAKFA